MSVLLGDEVVKKLFEHEDPIDKMISVGNNRLKIIGLLEIRDQVSGLVAIGLFMCRC